MTVQELAVWLGGEVRGDAATAVNGVAKIEEAKSGDITFLANPKYEKFLATTNASVVLVSRKLDVSGVRPTLVCLRVDDPYVAFLKVLKRLSPSLDPLPTGVHPSAVIASSARLGKNVSVGAHSVIDEHAEVGDNTRISHACVVGVGAKIGTECTLYPRVTVYHQCVLGNRVVLHSGVVVGSDGFGFAPKADGTYEKIPQVGTVVIEDDVEIGSNTTIDRATMGETLIKSGVKIDNLVQIAHNVTIGENTVIAGQAGISGSVKIGKNCMIAGQVGIAGHLEIADRTVLMAKSGVPKSITEPGKAHFGIPVKEQHRAARIEAVIRSLPEMSQDLTRLKHELETLRQELLKAEHEDQKP